jgi:hypothetical protein
VTTPTGPLSPYVTPEVLTAAPTGISWSTIPPGRNVTEAQHYAEQSNICARATAMCDTYCNQVLRATLDTEVFRGPNFRVTVLTGSRNGRVILQRWPILGIESVQVAPDSVFPRQWLTVPDGYYEPEYPPIGLYGSVAPSAAGEGGQSIIIAPGYINWALGRDGWVIQVQYYNGWPHCGLTANAAVGVSTLSVDDCTGWGLTASFSGVTGATGTIYDAGSQETVQVTATSTTSGPGMLTLASPLMFAHDAGTVVSTLPQSVSWAAIQLAASIALTRGATATTVQTIPGGSGSTTGSKAPGDMMAAAQALLMPFKRVI